MKPISITENGLYGSYGGGAKAGMALGYMFNKIVGVELGLNYFQSGNQLRERTSVTLNGAPGEFLFEQKAYARALAVIPSLVMTTGNEQGPSPYARFSFVVPVWGDLIISTDIQDPFGRVNPQLAGQPAVYDREDKIDPVKPQFGFEGAMGVLFPVNNRLSFFAEAEFRTLTVDGDNRETTKFDVSVGSEQLQTLEDFPVGITQGIFRESLNNTMPKQELSSFVSISFFFFQGLDRNHHILQVQRQIQNKQALDSLLY